MHKNESLYQHTIESGWTATALDVTENSDPRVLLQIVYNNLWENKMNESEWEINISEYKRFLNSKVRNILYGSFQQWLGCLHDR